MNVKCCDDHFDVQAVERVDEFKLLQIPGGLSDFRSVENILSKSRCKVNLVTRLNNIKLKM